ncbi:MAG: alkaline phosphatase family protein [bacterium]|nr:alkaline phosphatase family protein [bacterium]
MTTVPRAVIIGLDGVPHRLIERYASDGTMPNLGRILSRGTLRKMASSVPDVSCVAWSTVITGKNAGEHGVYGFMNLRPGTYRFSFPTFDDLGARPFWEEMPGRRAAVINVPGTYPAREMNGALISGFVALDLAKATHPKALVPELERIGYRIDVDASKGHSDMDAFLRDLAEETESKVRAYRHLWERGPWDVFFLVFTGTDRLGHFLFEAFDDGRHPYAAAFRAHFARIDEVLGEIEGRAGGDGLFMMLSDHGFGPIGREVNVNRFLAERGFLRVVDPSPDSFEGVGEGSRAFALDPCRVYVHLAGRYPRGRVPPADRERVAEEVAAAFGDLRIDGRPVARRICRRAETFSGPHLDAAPDLVVLPHRGFDLKARLAAPQLVSRGAFTGAHTQDDAFLFLRSGAIPESAIPAAPWVGDVRGLIERGIAR